jgi:hypothetical protein
MIEWRDAEDRSLARKRKTQRWVYVKWFAFCSNLQSRFFKAVDWSPGRTAPSEVNKIAKDLQFHSTTAVGSGKKPSKNQNNTGAKSRRTLLVCKSLPKLWPKDENDLAGKLITNQSTPLGALKFVPSRHQTGARNFTKDPHNPSVDFMALLAPSSTCPTFLMTFLRGH